MLSVTSFDELNQLVGYERSMPYEQYFGEMDISEADKQKRINLANDLEDVFLESMALMFTLQQNEIYDFESAREHIYNGYIGVISAYMLIDDDVRAYAEQLSQEIVDVTNRHLDDEYYYSHDRAILISENESNTSWNNEEFDDAIKNGMTHKKWKSILDKETRTTHRESNGQTKLIEEPFYVGNSYLMFPKDTSLGASSSEIVNCRCSITYTRQRSR